LPRDRRRQLVSVGGNLMSFDLLPGLWREKDVSVIHSHTLGRIGGIALTIAKRRRLPFVITVHGGALDLPEQFQQGFDPAAAKGFEWGKILGFLFQSRNLFVDASAIVTCNETEASLLRRAHPQKRVVVQPHSVPVEAYRRDCREAARRAFPQIQGAEVVLSLGRVDPFKNQDWLLQRAPEIFQSHPQALLVLAGPCTDEPYGEQINRRIRELGLTERVLLTGPLPPMDPRLIGLLQEAQVMVLSSISETFGLVILEAWAAGTPVIASRTSGASALIGERKDGWLYDLEDPTSLLRCLDELFADPEGAKKMAERGREKVIRDYDNRSLAQKMKHLYEEVIEERRCVT